MSGGAVDTKAVEMRFDNSDFEKNTKQSISTLERLKHALKLDGASAGLKEVERASKKLDFKDLNNNVDGVGKRFSVLETIATGALLRIGASAAEAGMRIAKSLTLDQVTAGWNKYEQKTTAVQTIMANLRDTQDRFVDEAAKMDYVNSYLEKLMWFSDETSYSFTDMTDNVGKFIANGQDLGESVTAMQGIATWAAISGQRTQSAARAMYNISQAMGTGSMKVIDWKSIENANMATAEFKETAINTAIAMKKLKEGEVTVESFRDSLQKGWFDKDVMMSVFSTYGEAANKIQEYSAKTGKTATEIIREIRNGNKKVSEEVGVTADSLGFRALSAAQEAKTFTEVLEATADAVSTKWLQIFENIFGNYLEAKELWSNFAEDLWDIFASPLDTLNDVMSLWNKGFFENGPSNYLQRWYESGKLDDLENGLHYISKEIAEEAVASDAATYSIQKLDDGTERLVKTSKTAAGEIKTEYKTIYDAEKDLLSGRQMLIEGFKNILDTVFHDVENEDGSVQLSILGSIKQAFQEIVFGSSDVEEIIPSVASKLWQLTKRFRDFTERMRPSEETLNKVKNSFKGIFELFKIGGKVISAIAKPFKDLFSRVFKNPAKGLLDLTDSIGSWIQRLHEFLEENKIFDKVTDKVTTGLSRLQGGLDKVTLSLFGLTAGELSKTIRDKVFGFFDDFDFEAKYEQVSTFFNNIEQQILQVKNGDLPEKLTPFQKFLVTAKTIFGGIKDFVSGAKETIFGPGPLLTNIVNQVKQVKSGDLPETLTPFQKFLILGTKVFNGIKTFLSFVSRVLGGFLSSAKTLFKTGDFGAFFKSLGQVFTNAKTDINKSGMIGTLIDTFKSLDFKGIIGTISDALSAAKDGIVDSGVLGKFFQGLGKVFTAATNFLADIFNGQGLFSFLKTAAKVGIVAYLVKFVYSLFQGARILGKVGGLIDSIGDAFDSIAGFFKAKKFRSLSQAVLSFGAAILLLSLSVSMLGRMKPEELYRGIIALALLALLFTGFSKLNQETEGVKSASLGFAIFAVAIAILTNSVKKLGELDVQQIMKGIVAIAALALIFSMFGKLSTGIDGIGKAALSFIAFGIAVDILAIGVKALGKLDLGQLVKGVGAIAALVLVFSMLTKLNDMRIDLGKIASSFMMFGVAVAILSIGIKSLGQLDSAQLLGAVVAIGVLALIFTLLGRLNEYTSGLSGTVGAFAIFAIAVDIMSIGMKALGKLDAGQIAKGVIAIGAMVLIFSLLTKLNDMRVGMAGAVGSFLLFGIAVDLMSIGIKSLGELDTAGLYNSITAIAAVVALFAVFNRISSGVDVGSIGSLLAFSVVIIALSVALKSMVPVMQQIQAMGDDWWKPLVYMAAAIGLLVAAGAISGIGLVSAGLMTLAIVAIAFGAACLLAGLGIEAAADGLANLAEAVATYGPEAVDNIKAFIDAFLSAIISSGPKLALAGTVLILSLAIAIASSAGALVSAAIILVVQFVLSIISTLVALMPALVEGIVSAINAMAEAIRVMAPALTKAMMSLLESLVEAVIVGIATIVEPWGGVGAAISDKIMKWIPGIRNAFGVASDTAEAAGEEAADSYVEGFNGGGAGRSIDAPEIEVNQSATSTGVDMESIMSKIPGLSGGETTDISQLLNIDMSGLTTMFGDSIGGIDFSGMMNGKMGELTTSIEDSTPDVSTAAQSAADAIEEPITSLDAYTWGADIGNNLSSGLQSVIPTVETTASDMAAAIAKYVHFSEPDEGPLSNFHTFAPDMIKLWCKGVRDNVGQVESSGETMADAVYDGFSTALDYVSDLIDNGMSDQLTIRPVMDLSEIQNGVDSMYGMMSSANGYEITGTTRLAASSAYGMRGVNDVPQTTTQTIQSDSGPISNTFYITNGDPNAVAEKVSKILSQQTRRQKAIWAK